jgi:hypothetical protein
MKRSEQHIHNQRVIGRIRVIKKPQELRIPDYDSVINILNSENITTSRGGIWTRRSLYRMLQREGYSGLWGLYRSRCS